MAGLYIVIVHKATQDWIGSVSILCLGFCVHFHADFLSFPSSVAILAWNLFCNQQYRLVYSHPNFFYPCHSIMATIGKSTSISIRQPSDKPELDLVPVIMSSPFASVYEINRCSSTSAPRQSICSEKGLALLFIHFLMVICINFHMARVRSNPPPPSLQRRTPSQVAFA